MQEGKSKLDLYRSMRGESAARRGGIGSNAYKIFTEQFRIITTNLDMLVDAPDIEEIYEKNIVPTSYTASRTGVQVIVESPMEEFLIDMIRGVPRMSGTEEENRETLNEKLETSATLAKMAEILDADGYLELVDYSDARIARATLNAYCAEIADLPFTSPHETRPPEDEMQKLSNLADALADLDERAKRNEKGHVFSAAIRRRSIKRSVTSVKLHREPLQIKANVSSEPSAPVLPEHGSLEAQRAPSSAMHRKKMTGRYAPSPSPASPRGRGRF